MQSQRLIETELHRVILFASSGAEVLIRQDHVRLALPTAHIPLHQRVAKNLTGIIRREWSQNVVSLFGLNLSSAECERRYQVAESTAAQSSPIAGFQWVSVSSLVENQFEEADDYKAIASACAQCQEFASGREHGPFGQLGWFAELAEWTRNQIRPLGFTLNGRFTQLNATPTFTLIRFETNGPAVWFKAVGEPNLREYPITLTLCSYFPAHTTHVLAARDDWNGWLAMEAVGTHPTADSDIGIWTKVVTALAGLQINSFGRTLHLLNSGCRDARICSLSRLVEPFFEVIADLMDRQNKQSPPPLTRNQLLTLRTQLHDALSEAAKSEIPNAIGHLDFNMGNVVASHDRCVFLDWAEACIGHPFLTFQYLLEHFRRHCSKGNFPECTLTSAYVSHWSSFVSQVEVGGALRISPLLAAFAYAACGDTWRDPAIRDSNERAGYLRSLTRRMKSEADRLRVKGTSGSMSCHS